MARAYAPALTARPLAAPTGRDERIGWIDVLRGVAILGILPVNAPYFAYVSTVAEVPEHPGGAAGAWVQWLVHVGFEYKFITLFAFLFGLGIGLQARRAEARGATSTPVMLRRLAVLGVFGALHATLVWWGDVVFVYAVLGLVVMWCAQWRADTLLAIAGALLVLYLAAIGLLALGAQAVPHGFVELFRVTLPDGVGGDAATGPWQAFAAHLDNHDPDFESAVLAHAPYGRAVLFRAATWIGQTVYALVLFGPRLVALMLLGLAAVQDGRWLQPDSPGGRRVHAVGACVALPLGVFLETAATGVRFGTDRPAARLGAELVHQVGSLALAAGIASVVALVVARRGWSRPLAAVGRTAFSCYIGQSLLMTTLFYGHGFGLFERVGRQTLLGIVLAVWVFELVAATLWLRWFRIGPLEWLWRSLTYRRPQPFRREAA